MKLYTEEQMLDFANWCRIHDYYNRNQLWMVGQLLTKYKNTETLFKPITLPSDEDIEQYLNSYQYTKHLDDGQYNDGVIVGAELAIQWMKEQITKTK